MAEIINLISNWTVLAVILGYIFAVWLGLTVWTTIDISRRTDNWLYRLAMILLVAVGFFVGFAFYLMIRPTQTAAEAASQQFEERFLAASAAYAFCSSCGEPAGSDFNFCVNCGAELRKTCTNCNYRLVTSWLACPNCGQLQGPEVLPEGSVQEAQLSSERNTVIGRILVFPDWIGGLWKLTRSTFAKRRVYKQGSKTNVKRQIRRTTPKKTRVASREA